MRRPRFIFRQAVDGQWYFVLAAPNGRIVATSETYPDRATAEKGARAVKRWAPIAATDG